jgi:hypothetical protein
LDRQRAVVPGAVSAERGQQPWREDRPSAGEARKERRVGMRGEQFRLPGFIPRFAERGQFARRGGFQ